MDFFLAFCRAGFEKECVAEIITKTQNAGFSGHCKTKENTAHVLYYIENYSDIYNEHNIFDFLDVKLWIFARQLLWSPNLIINNLPETDKVTPIINNIILHNKYTSNINSLFVETPDVEQDNGLKNFCKTIEKPLLVALKKNNLLFNDNSKYSLHLFFSEYKFCFLMLGHKNKSSIYKGGIMRLKFPHNAPSRSTLKLEEAFFSLLSVKESQQILLGHQQVVDLGAAPGGWTYQFLIRNCLIYAIDNANLADDIKKSVLVEHIKQDAFLYTPSKKVAWMVCDMVEKPYRISQMIVEWLKNSYCNYTIFNLKLPMKKRYQEVEKCLNYIKTSLEDDKISQNPKQTLTLRVKHLYHDREEVTCFATLNKDIF